MINHMWIQASSEKLQEQSLEPPVEFDIACAQHCGPYHFKMKGKLTILEQADYDAWAKEAQINSERDYDDTDARAHWGWKWLEM